MEGRRFVCGRLFVKGGVGEVHIFLIHPLLGQRDGLTEALEVDNFPLPQEADHIVHVRVVGQAENVVVGKAGFLLCGDLARTTFVGLSDVTATEHILQGQGMFPNVSAHMRE